MKNRLFPVTLMFILVACHNVGSMHSDTDALETGTLETDALETDFLKQTTNMETDTIVTRVSDSNPNPDSAPTTTDTILLTSDTDTLSAATDSDAIFDTTLDTATNTATNTADIPTLNLSTCEEDSVEEIEAINLIRGIAMEIDDCLCASANGWYDEFTFHWRCYFGSYDDIKMTPVLDNWSDIESDIQRQLAVSDISCLPTYVAFYDNVEAEFETLRNTLETECDYPGSWYYLFNANVDESGQVHLLDAPYETDTDFRQAFDCAAAILEDRRFPCLASSEIEPFIHSIIE